MQPKALTFSPCRHIPIISTFPTPISFFPPASPLKNLHSPFELHTSQIFSLILYIPKCRLRHRIYRTCCISHDQRGETASQEDGGEKPVEVITEAEERRGELANQSIRSQIVEIAKFSGPATGLWICGPLMSLIDTAVIGQGSSIELAALGPGTVVCDYMSYVFMFLSIATSNMVATSLARQDKNEVQRQISILLFLGLTCGLLMFFFTRFFGEWALTAITGVKNMHLVPAAHTYVQIRGLAWPAVLIGWVAQSASLSMKDSWGPLKALAVASAVNGLGDTVLCIYLRYGIAGAAWATTASQVIAALMMLGALNNKGYNAFSLSIPSPSELMQISMLAGPVFITIASKVVFYSVLIFIATNLGTQTVAAHQVLLQTYMLCAVWGEPLSQTAQSFMPELIYGVNRSLVKARTLLRSLLMIGSSLGLVLGAIGTVVPWLFPNIFTHDQAVIGEMHKVLFPYFIASCVTPITHCCEGTLLAGRDLKFISLSMTGCLGLGSLLVLARFLLALTLLLSPHGVLFSEDMERYGLAMLEAA